MVWFFVTAILYFLDKGYKKDSVLNTVMVYTKYKGFCTALRCKNFYYLHTCFNGDDTAQIHSSIICELQFIGIFNK